MGDFFAVAKTTDIPDGKGQAFSVAGREIAVFHHKGKFYAMDDYCPHMGESLAIGDIHGDTVLCSRHLWAFQLEDGACVDVPRLQAETFEVRVEGEEILVRVPEKADES